MRPPNPTRSSAAPSVVSGAAFEPSPPPPVYDGSTYTLPASSGMDPHVVVPQPSGPSMGTQPDRGTAKVPSGHAAMVGRQSPSSPRNSGAQSAMPTAMQPSSNRGTVPAGHFAIDGRHTPASSTNSAAQP